MQNKLRTAVNQRSERFSDRFKSNRQSLDAGLNQNSLAMENPKTTGGFIGLRGVCASRIADIHYSVDSATEWTAVLPTDGMADSPREPFAFTTKKLEKGAHRVAVRVRDAFGNTAHAAITVTVE